MWNFLALLFPKGRIVGGNCYKPYHSFPKINLAEFTVLPNARHDSDGRSEVYQRIPNTISSRKKWIWALACLCFIVVELPCVRSTTRMGPCPNPQMYLHQKLCSCTLEFMLLLVTAQKPSFSQLWLCHPTPAYAPDPFLWKLPSFEQTQKIIISYEVPLPNSFLTMTLGKRDLLS